MAKASAARSKTGPAPRAAEPPDGLLYVESSGLVAALLESDRPALEALRAPWPKVTSALTFAEASRAILRARRTKRLTPQGERTATRALQRFERRCYIVTVNEAVLRRARRPFPVEPVRTLDAVHLATAEVLGEPPPLMTMLTRDARVRANASALGYTVV